MRRDARGSNQRERERESGENEDEGYSCKRYQSQRIEQRAADAADATDAVVPRYTAYIIH